MPSRLPLKAVSQRGPARSGLAPRPEVTGLAKAESDLDLVVVFPHQPSDIEVLQRRSWVAEGPKSGLESRLLQAS